MSKKRDMNKILVMFTSIRANLFPLFLWPLFPLLFIRGDHSFLLPLSRVVV